MKDGNAAGDAGSHGKVMSVPCSWWIFNPLLNPTAEGFAPSPRSRFRCFFPSYCNMSLCLGNLNLLAIKPVSPCPTPGPWERNDSLFSSRTWQREFKSIQSCQVPWGKARAGMAEVATGADTAAWAEVAADGIKSRMSQVRWHGARKEDVSHLCFVQCWRRELRRGMLPGLLAGPWALQQESLEGGWQVPADGEGEIVASC